MNNLLALLLSAALSSNVLVTAAPAALPTHDTLRSNSAVQYNAALVGISVLCARGVCALAAIFMLSDMPQFMLLLASLLGAAATLAAGALCRMQPDKFTPAVGAILTAVLVLEQQGAMSEFLEAIGTVAGYAIVVISLSFVIWRQKFVDMPDAMQGTPAVLCTLGILACALSSLRT